MRPKDNKAEKKSKVINGIFSRSADSPETAECKVRVTSKLGAGFEFELQLFSINLSGYKEFKKWTQKNSLDL